MWSHYNRPWRNLQRCRSGCHRRRWPSSCRHRFPAPSSQSSAPAAPAPWLNSGRKISATLAPRRTRSAPPPPWSVPSAAPDSPLAPPAPMHPRSSPWGWQPSRRTATPSPSSVPCPQLLQGSWYVDCSERKRRERASVSVWFWFEDWCSWRDSLPSEESPRTPTERREREQSGVVGVY